MRNLAFQVKEPRRIQNHISKKKMACFLRQPTGFKTEKDLTIRVNTYITTSTWQQWS